MSMYIYRKQQILKQFGIQLNQADIDHMVQLQSEIAIDQFAHKLLLEYFKQFDRRFHYEKLKNCQRAVSPDCAR